MDDNERADDRPWSPEEAATIARAVNRAPSVHNTQPWSLSMRDRVVELNEQHDAEPSRHDPQGRDRVISCGAALTNLVLAVRKLGWRAELAFGDVRALVSVTGSSRLPPTDGELGRYEAIAHRTSHRRPFDPSPISEADERALLNAAESVPLVRAQWVSGSEEALHVARLLTYAARVQHADASYQRELASWIVQHTESERRGVPSQALGTQGLGAVGLVSGATHVPDETWLAARVEAESVLVLSTPDDGVRAQLDAGAGLESAWLEATHRALGASVMTQCLQLNEIREGLGQRRHGADAVQALMRFGHPVANVPRSARRPLEELFHDDPR